MAILKQFPELELQINDPKSASFLEKYETERDKQTRCWFCNKRPPEQHLAEKITMRKRFRKTPLNSYTKEYKVYSVVISIPRCEQCKKIIPKITMGGILESIIPVIVSIACGLGSLFLVDATNAPVLLSLPLMLLSIGIGIALWARLKKRPEALRKKYGIIRYKENAHLRYYPIMKLKKLGWEVLKKES